MAEDFSTFVEAERAKLTAARQSLLSERQSIDARLAALDNEFAAIAAYEAAKTGKTLQPARSGGSPRARRGSRRESILHTLGDAPHGLTRGELIEAFGVKGEKSGEGAISNALSALLKAGQIDRVNGRYLGNDAANQMRQAAE